MGLGGELNHTSLFDAFDGLVGGQNVITITKQRNSRFWLVEFNESVSSASVIGKSITINNQSYDIKSPQILHKPEVKSCVLRIHWLPITFDIDSLQPWLKSYPSLTCIGTSFEHLTETRMRHVKNGVRRIKVQFKDSKESREDINKITGKKSFGKSSFLVTIAGELSTCLRCNTKGHIRANCPLKDLTCSKCSLSGHEASNCRNNTYAAKVRRPTETEIEDQDEEAAVEGVELVDSPLFSLDIVSAALKSACSDETLLSNLPTPSVCNPTPFSGTAKVGPSISRQASSSLAVSFTGQALAHFI